MSKVTKRKLKLKGPVVLVFKIIGFIICVILALFIFYRYQISSLLKYNYSEEASKNILFSFKKSDVLLIGENKTLNAAFESNDYKEEYFSKYSKIEYQKQKNLIKNINRLIKVGYTNNEISLILAHGNDQDVYEFSKRKRVRYLDEFFSFDYAKLKYYDRYVAYSNETGEDEETTVVYINLNMDKEPYVDYKNVNKFSFDMLVNKYNMLNKDFVPEDLVKISKDYTDEDDLKINRTVYNAFIEMSNACKRDDLEIVINSAYRSFEDQQDISDTYLKSYGQEYVNKYVATPGFSEHQTGLAFDIGSSSSRVFAKSKEYTWMLENAYKYGFILRFPSKYEDITLFRSEAWHFRYVGKKIAKFIHENDMSYEEYYVKYVEK